MPPIKSVINLIEQIKTIHQKKNEDYATSGNPFENFHRSAIIASWFKNDIDKAFTILIGTKLARLATLLQKETGPNNESIEDSFLDLSTYCILWSAYHKDKADFSNMMKQIGESD